MNANKTTKKSEKQQNENDRISAKILFSGLVLFAFIRVGSRPIFVLLPQFTQIDAQLLALFIQAAALQPKRPGGVGERALCTTSERRSKYLDSC
ncbi:MAG: hypothetical protein LAP21_20355 [Acidobacteriia bacterium]|nr:hypothetical protein [Terriglobia bacterium]